MNDLPYPTAILLDWDGTVIDSMGVLHDGYNIARAHFGLTPVDRDTTHAITMYEAREGLKILLEGEERVNEGLRVYTEYVAAHHLDYLNRTETGYRGLLPNVVEFLELARSQNLPLGIVTNKRRFMFDAELSRLGWNDWFGVTVCANETLRNKPAGDPALFALQQLDIGPAKNVWFLGDTAGDMMCAREAGLTGVYVGLSAPRADWPCEFVTDYESLVKKLDIKDR